MERNLTFAELDEQLEETYFDKNSLKIDLPSKNSVDKVSKFLKDEQSHQSIKNDYLMQLTFRNKNPNRNFISTNNIPQKHFQLFPTYEKEKTLRENKTFTVSDNKNESLLSSNFVNPIDKFINDLVEGEETKLEPYLKNQLISVADALQKELDMRSLPPIELMSFNGDSAVWLDFIENFKT